MASDGYTSVRLKQSVHTKILRVKSPGETIAGCIERAVSVLEEVKALAKQFNEGPDYQAWLKRKEG